MSEEAFFTLHEIFEPILLMNKAHSCASINGNNPICSTIIVCIGLIFMDGEHVNSLNDSYAISKNLLYNVCVIDMRKIADN